MQQPWEEEEIASDPNAAWANYAPADPSQGGWNQPQQQPAFQQPWQAPPAHQQQHFYPPHNNQWQAQAPAPPNVQWQAPTAPAAQWQAPTVPNAQWQAPTAPNAQWQAPTAPAAQRRAPPALAAIKPPVVEWKTPDLNDPMLNAGLQASKAFMDQQLGASLGSATLSYASYTAQLKALYFNVNNGFILSKLRTLLFPFAKKEWARAEDDQETGRKDVNAPDLYIPLMALSTYVLAVGLAKGTTQVFNPEVIVEVFGSSVFCQSVQVVVMRAALYLLVQNASPTVSWLDLMAYSGYQYVGVALNMLVGVLFGPVAYNAMLAWTAACAAFVMFKTMQTVVGGTTSVATAAGEGNQKKLYFVLFCAVLQVAVMWFLGFTRDLRSSTTLNVAADRDAFVSPITTMSAPPVSSFSYDAKSSTTKPPLEEIEDDDDYEREVKARKAKRRSKKQQQQQEPAQIVDV